MEAGGASDTNDLAAFLAAEGLPQSLPFDQLPTSARLLQLSHLQPLAREARVMRYREKKKTRKFEKTIRYASRKAYAESRPRVKVSFHCLLFEDLCCSRVSRLKQANRSKELRPSPGSGSLASVSFLFVQGRFAKKNEMGPDESALTNSTENASFQTESSVGLVPGLS